jgi:hypothetical protein
MTDSNGVAMMRDITDAEGAFLDTNDWVYLPRLISEQRAAEFLRRIEAKLAVETTALPGIREGDSAPLDFLAPLSADGEDGAALDDVFYDFSHSPQMGAAGAKLLKGPVRFFTDMALAKRASGGDSSSETGWHIDYAGQEGPRGSLFRTGDESGRLGSPVDPPHTQVMVWIALNHIPPERGSLRFIALKDVDANVKRIVDEMSFEESCREFERLGIVSPPLDLQPGDATVHRSALHGAPKNTTADTRWAYAVALSHFDARPCGKSWENSETVELGKPFPDEIYPVLAA